MIRNQRNLMHHKNFYAYGMYQLRINYLFIHGYSGIVIKEKHTCYVCTVQLACKFTAHIGKNAYLAKFFARHEELHTFDVRVSRLLAQATMLASYAVCGLYILTCIPTRDGFPVHINLLASCFTQ